MRYLFGLAFSLLASFAEILFGAEQYTWVEDDKKGHPVSFYAFAYTEFDAVVEARCLELIPLYARAMAPFEIEQIQSIPSLQIDHPARVKAIPPELREEELLPFFESSLLAKYQEFLASLSNDANVEEKYCVIAKDGNDRILGFAHFWMRGDGKTGNVELEPLMIDPPAQGRGLARKLIFSIFKLRPDIERIYLSTNAKNAKACAVYRHLGFKEKGRIQKYPIDWDYGIGIVFEFVNH